MWQLTNETETERTYTNGHSEIKTILIHTDEAGLKWWGFDDILNPPPIRMAHSKLLNDLFQTGTSAYDLKNWFEEIKQVLQTNDTEKYEKIYAMVLQKENAIAEIVDPLKQHLALATVYILSDKEPIDFFNQDIAEEKLSKWDRNSQAFFLDWFTSKLHVCTEVINELSKLALNLNHAIS